MYSHATLHCANDEFSLFLFWNFKSHWCLFLKKELLSLKNVGQNESCGLLHLSFLFLFVLLIMKSFSIRLCLGGWFIGKQINQCRHRRLSIARNWLPRRRNSIWPSLPIVTKSRICKDDTASATFLCEFCGDTRLLFVCLFLRRLQEEGFRCESLGRVCCRWWLQAHFWRVCAEGQGARGEDRGDKEGTGRTCVVLFCAVF